MKAILLTQETCPNCDSQKMFVKAVYKGTLDNAFEEVKREEDEARFSELVKLTETGQTPTTIFMKDDEIVEVVKGFNPGKLKTAIERNLK